MNGFLFDGQHSNNIPGLIVTKVHRPLSAERTLVTKKIKGKPGVHLQDVEEGALVQSVDVELALGSQTEYEQALDTLKGWLVTKRTAELSFDKELDRSAQAILDGSVDLEEIATIAKGTLVFVIPDGVKYSPEISKSFNSDTHTALIENNATVGIYPVYRFKFTEDSTYLAVATPDGVIQIGRPAGVNDVAEYIDKKPVLIDTLSDFTGWTETGVVEDDWHKAGSIEIADGDVWRGFRAADFGTYDEGAMPKDWHGPAMVKALLDPAQDFNFYFNLEFTHNELYYDGTARSRWSQMGREVLTLLDANDAIVAMVEMHDTGPNGQKATPYARLGADSPTSPVVMDYWDHPDAYEHYHKDEGGFIGRIYGGRRGNRWFFQPGLFYWKDGIRHSGWRKMFEYIDHDNEYSAPITKVQLSFLKYKDDKDMHMLSDLLRVYGTNISDPAYQKVPILFNREDEVVIDTRSGQVYKNGELFMQGIHPGSDFNPLPPGEHIVTAEPLDSMSEAEVSYSRRWL